MMTQFDQVNLQTKANVYFDGKCVSHSFVTREGVQKSVGVILPSHLTFKTGAAEIMQCVAGHCDYQLAGQNEWHRVNSGEQFAIPANSSFDIRVTETFHYICHFEA